MAKTKKPPPQLTAGDKAGVFQVWRKTKAPAGTGRKAVWTLLHTCGFPDLLDACSRLNDGGGLVVAKRGSADRLFGLTGTGKPSRGTPPAWRAAIAADLADGRSE